MSPAPGPARRAGERGFILVGVVTFMLALTILGLSLFALSSYEAQFFTASSAREQALQNAESGIELAKALLAMSPPPQRLEVVQRVVGQFGVTSALAYQRRSGLPEDTTSQGEVNWDSTLTIAVSARSGGVVRSLRVRYVPGPVENPYQRLLSSVTGVRVNTENGIVPYVLELRGGVWHPVSAAADTAWTANVSWPAGRPVLGSQPPLPRADEFVDVHLADPLTGEAVDNFLNEADYRMYLEADPAPVRFFRSPPSPAAAAAAFPEDHANYTFFVHRDITLFVKGTAVWVVPEGVCFGGDVTVVAETSQYGTPATLVIVARRNGRDPGHENRGIWFKGGLTLTDTDARLYLVSEGDIAITHRYNATDDQDVRRLNVVAGGAIELGGPASPHRFRLEYHRDDMDALADELLARGALPNLTTGMTKAFQYVASSWTETTPR